MVCIIAECKKLTGEMEILNKELNEVKSQILVAEYSRESEIQHQDRKAQEEITSLQQLVHGKYKHFLIHVLSKTMDTSTETIEESSFSKSEISRLLDDLQKLREENVQLRNDLHHQVCQFLNDSNYFYFVFFFNCSKIQQHWHQLLIMLKKLLEN